MALAKSIKILDLRSVTLARVAYQGSFQGIGTAYKTLTRWSKTQGLTDPSRNKTITIYHDDPNEVGMNHVRQSACIIADKEVQPAGEIHLFQFTPGRCVVGRYEVSFFQFKEAWTEITQWVTSHALQQSGDPFEVYQNNSSQHPQKKTIIDICIPIAS